MVNRKPFTFAKRMRDTQSFTWNWHKISWKWNTWFLGKCQRGKFNRKQEEFHFCSMNESFWGHSPSYCSRGPFISSWLSSQISETALCKLKAQCGILPKVRAVRFHIINSITYRHYVSNNLRGLTRRQFIYLYLTEPGIGLMNYIAKESR